MAETFDTPPENEDLVFMRRSFYMDVRGPWHGNLPIFLETKCFPSGLREVQFDRFEGWLVGFRVIWGTIDKARLLLGGTEFWESGTVVTGETVQIMKPPGMPLFHGSTASLVVHASGRIGFDLILRSGGSLDKDKKEEIMNTSIDFETTNGIAGRTLWGLTGVVAVTPAH